MLLGPKPSVAKNQRANKFPYVVPAWHLCRRHYAAHLGRRTISPERSRNAALIESGGLAL